MYENIAAIWYNKTCRIKQLTPTYASINVNANNQRSQKKKNAAIRHKIRPLHKTTQHNTKQHNTAQHSTTQHSTTQHNTTLHNTAQHNTTQHNTTQHNTTQHITAQHITTQHNTTQHNTSQHNTTQHITAQHNTTHHNTTQYRCSVVLLLILPKRQNQKRNRNDGTNPTNCTVLTSQNTQC